MFFWQTFLIKTLVYASWTTSPVLLLASIVQTLQAGQCQKSEFIYTCTQSPDCQHGERGARTLITAFARLLPTASEARQDRYRHQQPPYRKTHTLTSVTWSIPGARCLSRVSQVLCRLRPVFVRTTARQVSVLRILFILAKGRHLQIITWSWRV